MSKILVYENLKKLANTGKNKIIKIIQKKAKVSYSSSDTLNRDETQGRVEAGRQGKPTSALECSERMSGAIFFSKNGHLPKKG